MSGGDEEQDGLVRDLLGRIRRLDRETEARSPEGPAPGLSSEEFRDGCRRLRQQGMDPTEIAEVFGVAPSQVGAALAGPHRSRRSRRWLGFAAAAALAAAVWLALAPRDDRPFTVEVVPETLRSPSALPAGSSFSLRLGHLRGTAHVLVARIDPQLNLLVDFPAGPSQAEHRFADGDLVPGDSSGRRAEFSAGETAGRLTLIVFAGDTSFAAAEDFRETVERGREAVDPEGLDSRTARERLAEFLARELERRRGKAPSFQMLELEVGE